MAEERAVWGVDIGQAGLKALRLRYAEAADQVLAVAFDYVPHAKLLSQPDAVPHELIDQALDTFLSRNDIRGDLLALSVPGQTALARFITLPPVESSKVGEIVKYEARQQIPFALEDVIWDYQPIGGGIEESGFMLGAEVGLFAMKRDQVISHLQPMLDRKVEVETVQIAPLALQNFVCYDHMGLRVDDELEGGEEHTIVLDMGADNTTLLVTNGEKIWIRNVPIGGNHFTRALTKEMKLTFAKAEHLKCNATKSPDPRAVFQALRPVFNDYVSEIQRSIGYFSSVNREAKIGKIIGVGNGFRLAGLQKFLQQNLQYDVERIDSFQALAGDTVLNAPVFQENILSFVVPYGLALQTLKLTRIKTTLLPPEIATVRKIRRKKPWAVGTAAAVLFGLAASAAGFSSVASSVSTERFGEAEKKVNDLKTKVSGFESGYTQEETDNAALQASGNQLVATLPKREYWLELYRSLNECLPRDVGDEVDIEEITKKNRISIQSVTAKRYDSLDPWFQGLSKEQKFFMSDQDTAAPPTGFGYIMTLRGEHYHHDESRNALGIQRVGINYVIDTLVANMEKPTVQQAESERAYPVRMLGISHIAIMSRKREKVEYNPNRSKLETTQQPSRALGGFRPRPGIFPTPKSTSGSKSRMIDKTSFLLQFVWKPTPESERVAPAATPAPAAGQTPAVPAAGQQVPGQRAPTAPPTGNQPVTPAPPNASLPNQPAGTTNP